MARMSASRSGTGTAAHWPGGWFGLPAGLFVLFVLMLPGLEGCGGSHLRPNTGLAVMQRPQGTFGASRGNGVMLSPGSGALARNTSGNGMGMGKGMGAGVAGRTGNAGTLANANANVNPNRSQPVTAMTNRPSRGMRSYYPGFPQNGGMDVSESTHTDLAQSSMTRSTRTSTRESLDPLDERFVARAAAGGPTYNDRDLSPRIAARSSRDRERARRDAFDRDNAWEADDLIQAGDTQLTAASALRDPSRGRRPMTMAIARHTENDDAEADADLPVTLKIRPSPSEIVAQTRTDRDPLIIADPDLETTAVVADDPNPDQSQDHRDPASDPDALVHKGGYAPLDDNDVAPADEETADAAPVDEKSADAESADADVADDAGENEIRRALPLPSIRPDAETDASPKPQPRSDRLASRQDRSRYNNNQDAELSRPGPSQDRQYETLDSPSATTGARGRALVNPARPRIQPDPVISAFPSEQPRVRTSEIPVIPKLRRMQFTQPVRTLLGLDPKP